MRSCYIFCLLCLIFLIATFGWADNAEVKRVKAVRIKSSEAPVIDGNLGDEVWKKANVIDDFIEFEPSKGGKPKELTRVYVLYDEEKLYVGFECQKKNPNNIMGTQTKRDSWFYSDDFVEVFLDTYHDCRNCYSFAVNSLGAQSDRRIANEGSLGGGGPDGDMSRAWDCAWKAKSSKNDNGWTAEMAIPFSELRFNRKGDGVWGINFMRGNEEFDAEYTWSDIGDRSLNVSRFGCLDSLEVEDLVVSRPLEFKPYFTAKPRISPDEDITADTGIDIRYPLSTITVDFTLNPDYGQIEADPARINLQDVEMRLAEKRPFFQEGMELFQSPIEMFYTRRVGIKDLMYGIKAVGKLGDYNIALLDCQSDDTQEIIEEEIVEEELHDETNNNYFVLRTQRDVGANSSIGIIGINKQRADGYNRAGSVDANITLPMQMRFIGQYARSWLPDKDDDAFIINLRRRSRTFSFETGFGDIGPDFEVEPGFIERIDRRGFKVSADYEFNWEGKIFKSLRLGSRFERLENHRGLKTNDMRGIEIGGRFSEFFIMMEPFWYQHVNIDDESIIYTDKIIFFFTGFFPPKWVSLRSPIMIGEQEDKQTFFIAPGLSINPMEKLKLEVELQRLDREDERLMLNRRFTVSYQFTQQMFIRTSLEITRDDERHIFVLYSWEFRPESDFYLVYADDKVWDQIDRVILCKITYQLKWNIF